MPRLSKIGAAALAAFGWTSGTGASVVTASYLVVAGGGGGGYGGGGAGGLLTGSTTLTLASSYTVIVGSGGTGSSVSSGTVSGGANGGNSQFGSLTTVIGGGLGGGAGQVGFSGGSGGGAGSTYGTNISGGSATSGQGNAGGNGVNGAVDYVTGGGGGAGAAGGNSSGNTSGSGGNGSASSISGTSVYYAGGGGGGARSPQGTSAGSGSANGGGGAGSATGNGSNGTIGLGSGGGGACITGGGNPTTSLAGNGGAGVVIISYAGQQLFGGGVVTFANGKTIHTFNTSGTLTPISQLSADYLIVGGGGGGSNGGGGAGGMLTGSGIVIDTNSTYLVTVGAGGAGATTDGQGTSGANSAFSIVPTTVIGGGGAGGYGSSSTVWQGLSGGSGGGGGARSGAGQGAGGVGTSGQGNAGGSGYNNGVGGSPGGGGGGAGAAGGNASGTSVGGNGGVGLTSSISGTSTYYAGGGGGCAYSGTQGTGGAGGGGAGVQSGTPNAGTANTGGGGGGNFNTPTDPGGAGGSGVVIIRYAGSTQLMAGGTVTITGGYVIHTFTSSGYLSPLTYVGNSLRFRGSASAYLQRTPTTASNRKTWTWSGWVKRGTLGTSARQAIFASSAGSSDSTWIELGWAGSGTDTLYVTTYSSVSVTTAVYRDPAAWYHVVLAFDTTQATSSNRIKLYVNGVLQANSGGFTPTLNGDYAINNTQVHQIGADTFSGSLYLDGYMANINFIDGQALTPNSFGTFNSYGVWQPITYGGSYGTNGFYLPFKGNQQGYTGIFNGSSQYLSLTSTSALVVASSTAFTLECFVNFNNFTATTQFPSIFTFPSSYQLYVNSSGVASFYNGSSDLVTGTIGTGGWNHIAVSRDTSGNLSMWINGVRTSTTTGFTASFGSSSGTLRIASYNGTGGFVNGYLSNIRFVNGTAVYNPTSANITVPTTTLTAVTNTALLTCQNATFVDNSTNAFSITNNGTATTAQTYPMSYNIQYDQGPSGNNWTSSGISYTTGSNLDVMTDVPTLTSTTVANYCVLNPLHKNASAPQTYQAGNLYWVNNDISSAYPGFATMLYTQKSYFEVTFNGGVYGNYPAIGSSYFSYNGGNLPGSATLASNGMGGFGYWFGTGQAWTEGTNSATYTAATTNDIGMIAYDPATGKWWAGLNGTWFNSGNPVAGTGYLGIVTASPNQMLPAFISYHGANFSVNFGQQPFGYTIPSGFTAMNTYNL